MVPFGTAAFEEDSTWSAGFRDSQLARQFAQARGVHFIDEDVLNGLRDGIAVMKEEPPVDASILKPVDQMDGTSEEKMAAAINAVGWSKVAIAFRSVGTFKPMAHNKLPALRRDGWRRGFEAIEGAQEGRPVMWHAARFLLELDMDDALDEVGALAAY
eukprot:scaffold81534_cov31-Tisochrysis_lutea.AAC.2